MPKNEKVDTFGEGRLLFRGIGLAIIVITLIAILRDIFYLVSSSAKFITGQIIIRAIFIIALGFIGYLIYRNKGKKMGGFSKVIGWASVIFLIILGIFAIIFSIFAFTNISTGLGTRILIVALILLLVGILAIRALIKKPNPKH